jgi:hypothetical protein
MGFGCHVAVPMANLGKSSEVGTVVTLVLAFGGGQTSTLTSDPHTVKVRGRRDPPKFPDGASPKFFHPTHPPMNAESYLRKQGWKGSGHSLDSTGRGIKKPLLIAHKQDQLGLGKKKAAWTTDDQWWMRAYDQSLQQIGTGQEVRGDARAKRKS